MSWYQIVFIILYLGTLFSYFFSETSGKFKRRVVNKTILASLFLLYFLAAFGRNYQLASFHAIAIAAFLFAWLGDVFLLFSFMKGGVLFMISNSFFIAYEILLCRTLDIRFSDIWWFVPLLAAVWGSFFILYRKGWLKIPYRIFVFYIATVTTHGTLGIAMTAAYPNAKMALLGLGLALFMVSDYFLALYTFRYKGSKAVLRLNSGTYFTGMLLAALSFSL